MKYLKSKNNKFTSKIQTIFILSFVVYSALILAVPNNKVLANFSNASTQTFSNLINNEEEIFVKVISIPTGNQAEVIAKNSTFNLSENCSSLIVKSDVNYIQQPNIVNLNDTASCYNLSVQQLIFANNKLAVQPLLKGSQTVKVLIAKSYIQIPQLSQSQESHTTPLIPLAVSFVILSYFILRPKSNYTEKLISKISIPNYLTLDFLQVYRC